jgi:GNAT superfamily N-acetyltransferase
MSITYQHEPRLTAEEYIDLLLRSIDGGGIWPVKDIGRINRMLAGAQIIMCARDEKGRLIGASRSLTDFAWCTYTSELAVDKAYQRQGVGRELAIRQREVAGNQTTIFGVALPGVLEWWLKQGHKAVPTAYMLPRER